MGGLGNCACCGSECWKGVRATLVHYGFDDFDATGRDRYRKHLTKTWHWSSPDQTYQRQIAKFDGTTSESGSFFGVGLPAGFPQQIDEPTTNSPTEQTLTDEEGTVTVTLSDPYTFESLVADCQALLALKDFSDLVCGNTGDEGPWPGSGFDISRDGSGDPILTELDGPPLNPIYIYGPIPPAGSASFPDDALSIPRAIILEKSQFFTLQEVCYCQNVIDPDSGIFESGTVFGCTPFVSAPTSATLLPQHVGERLDGPFTGWQWIIYLGSGAISGQPLCSVPP